MKTTAQIIRDYRGSALFSFGFRPFFLFAALWSAMAIPLWILSFFGVDGVSATVFTRDWHVHEMLFGYTTAVIVGYMTVAGANWTGRYPVAGRPVVLLVLLWMAGRLAMLGYPLLGSIAALIDAMFLIVFAGALWREQLAASGWRNLAPCIIISLLATANIGFHISIIVPHVGPASERMSIGLVTFLIALIGGRLVPSFTRNWMAQHKIIPEPASYGRFDIAVLGATGASITMWIVRPSASLTGLLLIIAGTGLFIRLLRWRGWVAASDGMVLILHLGYFWCTFGLALLGASIMWPTHVSGSAAIHALTAGAIGMMTLAVMTRTSRSHTGRERRADRPTLVIYGLAMAAATTRVLAPFAMPIYSELLVLSALSWSLAFAIFALVYGPMLARAWKRKV